MKLRTKIAWSLLILAGVGIMLEVLLYRFILLPSYESLERDEIRLEAERGMAALEGEIQHLRMLASDWGTWDDLYRFVQDQNPEFVKSNLELPTFTKNGLNLIGVYDRSGRRVWFAARGRDSAFLPNLPEFPSAGLPADHPLLRLETVDSFVAGLLRTTEGPMLVASVPIVTSENEGPIRGAFLMGRLLDAAYEQKLREQTRMNLRLYFLPPGATNQPGRLQFEPRADALRVSATLADLAGRPLLALDVLAPRRIMARGYAATRLAVIFSAMASILLLLTMAWLVRRFVVVPLDRIQRHAAAIRESADLSRRLAAGGADEIRLLSREFDLLLDRIQTMNHELDERVKARTAELESANVSLRKSRQAALNLMEDAVAARRRAEQTEAALRASEEKYRIIVETANEGIWITDAERKTVLVNRRMADMLGFTMEEMQARTPADVLDAGYEQLAWKTVEELEAGVRISREFKFRRKDGSELWVISNASPLRDGEGRYYRTVSLLSDITERKRMEEALRMSEERWRTLMDHVPMPVQGYNSEGIVTYWNQASERLYGFTAAEALGRNLGDLIIPPEAQPHFRQALSAGLSFKASGEFLPAGDIELLRKDGSLVSVFSTHTAVCIPGCPPILFCLDIDLTERKRAQEALCKSEEKYRLLFQNMAEGFALYELLYDEQGAPVDWRILEVNDAYARHTGTAPEQIVGRRISEVFPSAIPEYLPRFAAVVATQIPSDFETYAKAVNRHQHVVTFPAGGPRFANIIEDITTRKQTEEALRENEQRLREARELLEAVTLGAKVLIATVDKDFRYTFFNREHHEELKRLTGKETTLGMSLMEALAELPEERDKAIALWGRALKGETVVQTLTFGDPRRWHNTRHTPIRNIDGVIIGAGEVTSDVTELMQAQEALRESEERLRLALDAGAMATWDWRIPSGEVIWSDEHYRMLGYTVGEVKPSYRAWADRLHPDDAAATEELLRQSMERGTEYCAEFRVRRPDGTVCWVEARGRFECNDAGLPVRSYGVMLNITERKQVEEALRASRTAAYNVMQDAVEARQEAEQTGEKLRQTAEALAQSNKELEQFAYVVSHDLQEPLRMVTAFGRLLRDRYQNKLDEQAKEYLTFTIEGAERMQALVRDLLEYSRIDGKVVKPVPMNLQQSLDVALMNLEVSVRESGAKITHDPLPSIMDSRQLTRVFQNLIGNAIKFRKANVAPEIHIGAKKGSGVRLTDREVARQPIAAHPVFPDSRPKTPEPRLLNPADPRTLTPEPWLFSVRDNGIGIDPKFHNRIFEVFQRLHSREAYPGTGIGLAICKKIVEQRGGRIWVESEADKGSTFFFTLPG